MDHFAIFAGSGKIDTGRKSLEIDMRRKMFAILVMIPAVPLFAKDGCATLFEKTQAFSDAGQQGNGRVMAEMLDENVIFFNETGEQATRADMANATPPSPGAVVFTIRTTDWNCKLYGGVAVTSFIDVLERSPTDKLEFRSVEAWRKDGQRWKMIGSETLTLQQDPDPIALDAVTLDEYAGRYAADTGMQFIFVRHGSALVATLNAGAETTQNAQARDIFFTPGHGSTPKIFQRDKDGRITGFILWRGKNSITFKRVA